MSEESPAPIMVVADPAPLGLAGFALTTFLLSFYNTHHAMSSSGGQWVGYAFAYGGLIQLLAGMWEFKNKNVFGATAFSTYGGFWIGLYFYVINVHSGAPGTTQTSRDLGWILLAFLIFNTYMLIASTQLNYAVFAVFLTLELTELVLCIGQFTIKTGETTNTTLQIGGWIGVITAFAAWYASAAGVMKAMKGRDVLPVGGPLFDL